MADITVSMLCACENCHAEVTVSEVRKTRQIPKNPNHVTVTYECVQCGFVGVAVSSRDDLQSHKMAAVSAAREELEVIRDAREELSVVEHPGHIYAIWAGLKSPPIIEDLIGVCDCSDCRARLFYGA